MTFILLFVLITHYNDAYYASRWRLSVSVCWIRGCAHTWKSGNLNKNTLTPFHWSPSTLGGDPPPSPPLIPLGPLHPRRLWSAGVSRQRRLLHSKEAQDLDQHISVSIALHHAKGHIQVGAHLVGFSYLERFNAWVIPHIMMLFWVNTMSNLPETCPSNIIYNILAALWTKIFLEQKKCRLDSSLL